MCSDAVLENDGCLSCYRRWILDIIPAVADHPAIKFLRHRIEGEELTELEAVQAVLVGLYLTTPTRDVVEEAGVGYIKNSQIFLYQF